LYCLALCAGFLFEASLISAAPPAATNPAPVESLSPAALEALVSGVALYPDPLVEQILRAARNPLALHQAAEAQRGELPAEVAALASGDESVDYLKQYPEVLSQLDEQLALTARLGVAYRTQPQDVWAAIANVRAAYDAALAEQTAPETADESSGGGISSGAAYPVYGGWVSRSLLAAGAIHELNEYRYDAYANPVAQTTTYVGPNGQTATVTSAGVSGQATVGDTTYFGAAGAGTATGPQGQSVTAAGSVHGSATETSNGVQVQTQASGAYATSTGAAGIGTRSGSTAVTQNADGSTSWDHSASGQATGTNGSASYQHTGEGTVTGDGTGSYQGSTTVNANGNSATSSTTAGNGQATTTVTNNNTGESKTYTAGDGQIENAPTQSSEAARSQQASGARDWSQMSREQISQASQAMKQSWGELGNQVRGASPSNAAAQRGKASSAAGALKERGASTGARTGGAKKSQFSGTQRSSRGSQGRPAGGGGRGGRGGRR